MKANKILSFAGKLYIVFIVSLFMLPNVCSPQATVDWYQIYKGPANNGFGAEQIAVDNSGNVFLTGTGISGYMSPKTNYLDIVTTKYNSSGVLQWQKSYFNTGNHQDIARALTIDRYSNVYVVGEFTDTTDNNKYAFVTLKYNSSGDLLWARKKNYAYQYSYYRKGIIVDSSMNVYVTCSDEHLSYLIKYNGNGDSIWTYSSTDYIIESMPDNENNIIIAGGNKIKKLSSDGSLLWTKTVPKSIYASNLTKDLIGNYYLCGEFSDTLYFYKISSSGELLWSKYFKKYFVDINMFYNSQRCILTKDGNILLGFETPNAIKSDITLMKFEPSGDLIWERKYEYADTSEQFLIELKEDSRGFIYACGYSKKNNLPVTQRDDYFVILKYDPDGKLIRTIRKEGLPTNSGIPKCFTIDSYDKLYLACQDESPNYFYPGMILAKFSQPFDTLFVPIPAGYNLSQNYPNPFNVKTVFKFEIPRNANVKLTVYNALGKRIETLFNGYLSANRYEISWDASSYSSGVYFYRLETEGFSSTKKMILVK